MKKVCKCLLLSLLVLLLVASLIPAGRASKTSGEVSTSISGLNDARIFNLGHALKKFNGLIVKKGEIFSFNDLVGPRNKASGFMHIEDERGKAIFGGGVSQIASTIDIALKAFGNDIHFLERHTYGSSFIDSYMPSGHDAVRVEYSTGKNYAFTNNHNSMQISLWLAGDRLYCVIQEWFGAPPDAPESKGLAQSCFARLKSYDPATGIAVFEAFEILEGQTAENYLRYELGYDDEDIDILYSSMEGYDFIYRDLKMPPIVINLDMVNLTLLYQPSGTPTKNLERIPSNGSDFRKLYQIKPYLLTGTPAYFIYVDMEGRPYLVEQTYPPHGEY